MSAELLLLFTLYSNSFSLPNNLLSAVCFVESNYKVDAVHYDDGNGDSLGVCQIKLSTARQLGFQGNEEDLMDPDNNIYYAAKYLSHQYFRYGQVEKAVIAYNQGSVKQHLHTKYSRKVMTRWINER